MGLRIGIDLGGTKIEIAALAAAGEELLRRRIDTPRGDYGATVAALARLVREAERELKAKGTVGIGIPGALSRATGLVKNANLTWLIGKPLKEDLEKALKRKVRLANDANCFALSEAIDGAGREAELVFGVILGTGVGGGIVVKKRVLDGPNAIAGEWGHNPLPLPTKDDLPLPKCWCGRAGCIETYLSGPGLEKDYLEATGEGLTAQAIAKAAQQGDAGAEATLKRYEGRLACALAGVVNLLDPEVIVLGGGLSKLKRLYENVPRRWAPHVFSDRVDTKLLPPVHGDSGGVRGAAWLWGGPPKPRRRAS